MNQSEFIQGLQNLNREGIRQLASMTISGGDPAASGSEEEILVGEIILTDLRNGATGDDQEISNFLGVPVADVFRVTANLLRNGVWPLEGLDLEDGIIFGMAVNAGRGLMRRSGDQWSLTDAGKEKVRRLTGMG